MNALRFIFSWARKKKEPRVGPCGDRTPIFDSMDQARLDAAMDPPVGMHNGRRFRLSETTLETVSQPLSNKLVPTKLRLAYLHSCLFRSSTPPGAEPIGRSLLNWDECIYCRHGNPQQLHLVAAEGCGCMTSPPPATAEVIGGFIKIMDALVLARGTLDWSIPASSAEQELEFGTTPNSSLVGEFLAEFEHSWKVILLRVPGHAPHGMPGDLPKWWTSGGMRAAACKANHNWLTALRGTGAKGARPMCGDVDRNDDVFNCTGWLLQSHRLAEIQAALAAVPPGEPTVELAYDDEGMLRLLPKGGYEDRVEDISDGAGAPTKTLGEADNAEVVVATATFAVGQHVEVYGLASRGDLNGRIGEVLPPTGPGAPVAEERYPLKVGAESVKIKPSNMRRTGASEKEGQIIAGRVMVFGEWFDGKEFMETSNRHGKAFSELGKAAQADVLAGRRRLAYSE